MKKDENVSACDAVVSYLYRAFFTGTGLHFIYGKVAVCMNWLDKLERKFNRFSIAHITRYMILANLIGYALYYFYRFSGKDLVSPMMFIPQYILQGQIWRLVTWIFIPSSSLSIWTMLFIVCLLMLGENLEYALGSFRMTVYFVGAILISDIGGMLFYLILPGSAYPTSLYYMSMYSALFSMYLMLGLFMPDAEVRLYFVLPIKMKYMMVVYGVFFLIELVSNIRTYGLVSGIAACGEMIFAVINLLIFVSACRHHRSPYQAARQKVRQQQYTRQSRPQPNPANGGAMHKCVICGRTEKTNPELQFRYCSKCSGAKEYCNDHLFTHTHC